MGHNKQSPPAKKLLYDAETKTCGFFSSSTPRIAEVVSKFGLQNGDKVRTNQSKSSQKRKRGEWGTIRRRTPMKTRGANGYHTILVQWDSGSTYETACKIDRYSKQKRRRMAQR